MKKNILISVTDKEYIDHLCLAFEKNNYVIYATKSTYNYLKKHNINCKSIETLLNFSEIFEGRIKTLHPKIYGGILADLSKKKHITDLNNNNMITFDYVIVNLYQFDKLEYKLQDIKYIDIGGVSMLRAAAKNYKYCIPIFDKHDYKFIIENIKNKIDINKRLYFASKTFNYISYYDSKISQYFNKVTNNNFNTYSSIPLKKINSLRYGENSHQKASLYSTDYKSIDEVIKQIHGKQLSFNNYLDIDSAIMIISEFKEPTAIGIKHLNPCCAASAKNIDIAWKKAYEGDPESIFGGVVVFNREVTEEIANHLSSIFLEIIIATSFSNKALMILKGKKNIRLLILSLDDINYDNIVIYRSVYKGLLAQDYDSFSINNQHPLCVTGNNNNKDMSDVIFSWKIVKHLKSNAICIVKNKQLLGIGSGQTSRIKAVNQAIFHAKRFFNNLNNCTLASDAFFPLPDSIENIVKSNIIKYVVQPGGSIKDEIIIDAAKKLNIIMYFTKQRSFKH